MNNQLEFTPFTVSFYNIGPVQAVQLTSSNFQDVQEWLREHDCVAPEWTNESFVIGLWVPNTWHDRGKRTPVPFGWWIYLRPNGSVGVGSEVAVEQNWTRG